MGIIFIVLGFFSYFFFFIYFFFFFFFFFFFLFEPYLTHDKHIKTSHNETKEISIITCKLFSFKFSSLFPSNHQFLLNKRKHVDLNLNYINLLKLLTLALNSKNILKKVYSLRDHNYMRYDQKVLRLKF